VSDTRTKILSAASELFLEGGAPALSVRAIASRAGLSTIGIYSHFQGKQGILDTLYIQGFNLVYKAAKRPTSHEVGVDDLLQASKRYLKVADANEAHYRLIFGEGGTDYVPSDEARSAAKRAFSRLVSLVGDFIADRDLKADRVQVAMDIWALLHGYVSISHHPRASEDWNYQALALRAVRTYLTALS